MVSPHRLKTFWQITQVVVHGAQHPRSKSVAQTFHAFGNNYGSMWQRNKLGLHVCRMLFSHSRRYFTSSNQMQKNKNSNGSNADRPNGGENQKSLPTGLITNTPQNIQVFADPTLTKCVRDLASDMQRVKSTLKYTKEEVADCVYEYIRLNNSYDSLKTTVKETSKLSEELAKETEGNAKSFKDKHKELETCLLYFTEKTVTHENQMRDINKRQEEIMKRLDEFVSNLDCVINEFATLRVTVYEELKPEVEGIVILARILGADDGSLQVDVKKITEDLLRIKKLLNDRDYHDNDKDRIERRIEPKAVNSEGEGPCTK